MFTPERSYGFVVHPETNAQCFFHLANFHWLEGELSPLPVIGEWLQVKFDPERLIKGSSPRALRAERLEQPFMSYGKVETFDVNKGYGFVVSDFGKSFYLHRSEVNDNLIPIPGKRVSFWEGFKKGRRRACYCETRESKF